MGITSGRSRYASNPIEEEDRVAEKLSERGRRIIKLNRGDPTAYFKTPKYMIDAYIAALKDGRTGYSDHTGVKRLREAVADRYRRIYNLRTDSNHILITQGLSEAIMLINAALINPGDRAILFKPDYPLYAPYLKLYGGKEIAGCYEERYGWNIDTDHLRRTLKKELKGKKNIKYIMVTNPNNPTGTVLNKSVLEEVVDLANEHGLLIVSDEIYDEIVYNKMKFISMCKLAKGVPHIIFNGASKVFDATGFRTGFTIVPEGDKFSEKLKKKFIGYAMVRLSSNVPAQYAVAEGLNNVAEHNKAIKSMVKEIEKRVNFATNLLNENEYLSTVRPNGAFYIFSRIDLKSLKFKNDKKFVDSLLQEKYVQITRGSGFGKPSHIRIVSLADKKVLGEAINRINDFCRKSAK